MKYFGVFRRNLTQTEKSISSAIFVQNQLKIKKEYKTSTLYCTCSAVITIKSS